LELSGCSAENPEDVFALSILTLFSGDHADEQHGWQAGNSGSGAESLGGKGVSKGMVLKGGLCEPVTDSRGHADPSNIFQP